MSKPDNTQELDVNKLEQIIADHNKEMRADMASEITGGTRSKAVTDVITVKAILGWHNKQVEAVLDRLKVPTINDVFPSEPYDGTRTYEDMLSVVSYYERLIQAERNRLKESE